MKNRFFYQTIDAGSDNSGFALTVCAAFYIFGSAFGAVLSAYVDDAEYFYRFFSAFFTGFSAGGASFFGMLFDGLRFLIAVMLLSVSAFGVAAIPAVSALKGFLTAFSIALITRLFGFGGIPAALAVSGIDALLFTPVLLAASATAFKGSVSLIGFCAGQRGAERGFPQKIWLVFIICVVLCAIIAGIETLAASWLASGITAETAYLLI